jgi:hypothetical protein
MQDKAFARDFIAAFFDPGSDVYFIPRPPGGASHREPVRDEIPVFRNQIEDFPRH